METKFHKHSIVKRFIIWVILGFVIWVLYALCFSWVWFSLFSPFWVWTVLVFMLMWISLAITWIFTKHPVFEFKMPWYLRWAFIWAIYMIMYISLSYNTFLDLINSPFVSWSWFESPYWAILDWICIWLLISFAETKIAWEWKDLPVK